MDEDSGVKAPVTRLRRRLSVEQSDENKSSPAPNTPTKKRGGRLAAKPELDLIDENAPEINTSKRSTKKTIVKDIETAEEKPVTPSRRSTRIKSNTSIVSDTQVVDSPRAKRAARRLSQIGSDNEAPLTPARQTRRTRKDSASNADKAELPTSTKPSVPVTEIIVEEPESNLKKPINDSEKPVKPNSPLRKSPRLSLKKKQPEQSIEPEHENKDINTSKELNTSNKENEQETPEVIVKDVSLHADNDNENKVSEVVQNRLSISSAELIKQVNNTSKKKTLHLNKSSSSVENKQSIKNKRHRTKSWTNPTDPIINDTKCYSDTESVKKKNESLLSTSIKDDLVNSSRDDKRNASISNKRKSLLNKTVEKHNDDEINSPNHKETQKLLSPNVDVKNTSKSDNLNASVNKKRESMKGISSDKLDEKNESLSRKEEQKLFSSSQHNKMNNSDTNLFDKEPNKGMQVTVYIEESDSNSDKPNKQTDNEDQCVPVVESHFVTQETAFPEEKNQTSFNFGKTNQKNTSKNDSCEPMDIDETMPDNIMQSESQIKVLDKSAQKSLIKNDVEDNVNEKSLRRKSSLTFSTSQTHDKTGIESKSTLVLSELKDISSNENYILQSPQISADKILSKSDCALNVTQNKDDKNTSLNYLTSTPLQQKNLKLKKLGMQVNTSAIAITNNASKVEENTSKNVSKTNVSVTSKASNKSSNSSEESGSEEESSEEENNFIDNEAEEASDDYESGDSKDEDEEQYERENEIVEKGVTLTSDEELSNDSDYEKDSFIVSSDEEDNELLDGSGDDLSMSDNELKMTAKSKKKYNERKLKEQKNASREMYESRHKLNLSNKSAKADSSKVKNKRNVFESSDSEEDDDVGVKLKKNNRRRLDSSHETSVNKSTEVSAKMENNKIKEATHNESLMNEVEMTVCEEIVKEADPLSIAIKKEPKTPQKDMNHSMQFVDSDNMKGNTDDKNKSHVNDEQADPLEESNESEYSDSSDNEHIQNYDSILNELNKSNKTKKSKEDANVSLNLDKKTKNKKATSIVEQLNLTQTKSKKSNKKLNEDEVDSKMNTETSISEKSHKTKTKQTPSKKDSDDEASSDSIDLHLLFSEESNSSEDMRSNVDKVKNDESNNDEEEFIPLKKSDAKTNILDSSRNNTSISKTAPSESAKKNNKKRKTLDKSQDDTEVPDEVADVQFFVDTTGSLESATAKHSLNVSVSKKKIGKQLQERDDDEDSDAPLEVSNKSVTETHFPSKDLNSSVLNTEKSQNKSITKTPKSEKKKNKRISETQAEEETNEEVTEVPEELTTLQEHIEEPESETDVINKSHNKSVAKTPKSEKKKKKRLSESQAQDNIENEITNEECHNISLNTSKKQRKSITDDQMIADEVMNKSNNKSITMTPGKEKKKKSKFSESIIVDSIDEPTNISLAMTPSTEKKKISRLSESITIDSTDESVNKSVNKSLAMTPGTEKKKKSKLSESVTIDSIDEPVNKSLAMTPGTEKKKKSKLSESITIDSTDEPVNKSLTMTPGTDKKKKSKLSESISMDSTDNLEFEYDYNDILLKPKRKLSITISEATPANENVIVSTAEVSNSKKRKRKSSITQNEKDQELDADTTINKSQTLNVSVTSNTQKKKRKVSLNVENSDNTVKDHDINAEVTANINEEIHGLNKKKTKLPLQNETNIQNDIICTAVTKKNTNKKRKEREDDDGTQTLKVLKVDSFDKPHVPRLPESIINQLEAKPKKKNPIVAKSEVISTSNFVVEQAIKRKNKPSNYLEESVYINEDDISESKKQKEFIKKPKVLPFLPTASTSSRGYTTNFKVNILPKEIQFVAKSSDVANYKNDYLQKKKIKRLGTYELYKRNRNIKMSKF